VAEGLGGAVGGIGQTVDGAPPARKQSGAMGAGRLVQDGCDGAECRLVALQGLGQRDRGGAVDRRAGRKIVQHGPDRGIGAFMQRGQRGAGCAIGRQPGAADLIAQAFLDQKDAAFDADDRQDARRFLLAVERIVRGHREGRHQHDGQQRRDRRQQCADGKQFLHGRLPFLSSAILTAAECRKA